MFERYSEKARRVIFYSSYGSQYLNDSEIKAIHLLLGFLREGGIVYAEVSAQLRGSDSPLGGALDST
jgi:hypothetical protein